MSRTLAWFSCGAASAVAARLAVEEFPGCEVLYCDTLAYEHPDNVRFMADVAEWIGRPIKLLKSTKYTDIYDVFRRTGWLVGPHGARCTQELKKRVRQDYQRPGDLHILGLTADEGKRIARFEANQPDVDVCWLLQEHQVTKADCYSIIRGAGIDLPAMYGLGYNNNNCIGCVKGQAGYWNKIRVDFPAAFDRMAAMERELDAAICKTEVGGTRQRIFLDELPPDLGRDEPRPDMDCGLLCSGLQGRLIGRYEGETT
jgi:3'-phosphoadenosine 5'-phosphosulfate sulfotransferase (PAPS reductase)/FAD synthetase